MIQVIYIHLIKVIIAAENDIEELYGCLMLFGYGTHPMGEFFYSFGLQGKIGGFAMKKNTFFVFFRIEIRVKVDAWGTE